MVKIRKLLRPAIVLFAAMTILCGGVYTAAVTGVAQWLFPAQANGSVITATMPDGTQREYGSELYAQAFTKPEYLIGRPMGATNLSTVSDKQAELVAERIAWWRAFDPENTQDIPQDLVTASGSGVDPHISPAAAEFQVARIAKARNVDEAEVRKIIADCTSGRLLGFLGEPGVNVLKVNLRLDGLAEP